MLPGGHLAACAFVPLELHWILQSWQELWQGCFTLREESWMLLPLLLQANPRSIMEQSTYYQRSIPIQNPKSKKQHNPLSLCIDRTTPMHRLGFLLHRAQPRARPRSVDQRCAALRTELRPLPRHRLLTRGGKEGTRQRNRRKAATC